MRRVTSQTESTVNAGGLKRRGGYTIVELLAVAGILIILLAFAAGALGSLLRSSERSLAENQLRVGLSAARDLALRSESGDAVAVFIVENGRCKIVPAVSAGILKNDEVLGNNGQVLQVPGVGDPARADREVFVQVPLAEPVTLPLRWTVRGFADPGLVHRAAAPSGWYEWIDDASNTLASEGNWVFPETNVLDIDEAGEGWRRQTFVVRYEAQTGNLVTNNNATILVVDAVASDEFRNAAPFQDNRLDELDDDLVPVVRRLLASRSLHPLNTQANQTTALHRLLGDRSNDTILCKPVQTIALALENNVASGISARGVNRTSNTLLVAPQDAMALSPLDLALVPGVDAERMQRSINGWISPNLAANAPPVDGVARDGIFDARIFTFSRYLGAIQEVKP